MHGLDGALATYLSSWGPIDWRADSQREAADVPAYIGGTLAALSAIETDSRVMYKKIRVAGVDRDPRIREFLFPWLAEEAEHGRALRALANVYGESNVLSSRRARRASFRNGAAWPTLAILRPLSRHLRAAYCVVGMMQEHIALSTYRHIADLLDGRAGSATLVEMSRQEGRHMRFYREASFDFLRPRTSQIFARAAVVASWNPVGIDALGVERWWEAFGPLLAEPVFRKRLLALDRIVHELPGFSGLTLISDFLSRNSSRIAFYSNAVNAPGVRPVRSQLPSFILSTARN